MKGGSEQLGETHFDVVYDGRIDRQEQLLRSYSARDTPVASYPEILLDGVVDQVPGRDNWLSEKKIFRGNNTLSLQSTSEEQEGNYEDERQPVRGRKIGSSYDYGGELPLISKIQST